MDRGDNHMTVAVVRCGKNDRRMYVPRTSKAEIVQGCWQEGPASRRNKPASRFYSVNLSEVRYASTEMQSICGRQMSRQEAAQALGVSIDTLDRLTARGEIRVHRVGRAPKYLWEELLKDTETQPLTVTQALRRV